MESEELGIRKLLADKGYCLVSKIGEGYWREVYEVNIPDNPGGLNEKLVAKVDKPRGETDSIQHKINIAKGNLSEREMDILRSVSHPNITRIYEILETDDGRHILIERFHDSISLEEYIERHGPIINPEGFTEIFSQVAKAMRYLHIGKGILHRDIKPSNILVGFADKTTCLTDFQNAAFLEDIDSKFLPTRGGTAYTHPVLLNSLVQGEKGKATFGTDIYALGISMFYALTKRCPFSYRIIEHDNGSLITVDNKTLEVALTDDGRRISAIDPELHEMQLQRELAQLPKQYRLLIHGCLSLKDGLSRYNNIEEVYDKLDSLLEDAKKPYGRPQLDFAMLEKLFTHYNKREATTIDGGDDPDVSRLKSEVRAILDMCERAVLSHGKIWNRDHVQQKHLLNDDGRPELVNNVDSEVYSLSIDWWNLFVINTHQSTLWLPNRAKGYNERDDVYFKNIGVHNPNHIWWAETRLITTTNSHGLSYVGEPLIIVCYNDFEHWAKRGHRKAKEDDWERIDYWLKTIDPIVPYKRSV